MLTWNWIDQDSVGCELYSLADCRELAFFVADQVANSVPLVIGLVGTLGAGKTQWTKFFVSRFGASEESISSPTFVLLQRYPTQPPIVHIDAYRVGDEDEFLELGIEEIFEERGITVVEWADRFPDALPLKTLWIRFEPSPNREDHRTVTLTNLRHFPRFSRSVEPPHPEA
ncbi:MAG: tRNA (adenosine(37)-N6)-threonylcarbamoyltransferase complex ATPase subunit type 1 TsaE [Planctomycetota bacterium]